MADDPITLFNRRLLRIRRARAAARFAQHDFMLRLVCERLADRLLDVRRDFPTALELGCRGLLPPIPGVQHWVHGGADLVCDEEWLPFADHSFDLILSAWNLHWVNDLPGALIQIRRALKPGGLFLGILPGARTLEELRSSLAFAQGQLLRGLSPQIAPFVEVRDAGDLLQRTGFAIPAADSELLTITYASPLDLMQELRGMGETNMLLEQRHGIFPRALFPLASQHYTQLFPAPDDPQRIRATVELITLTGWAP